MTSDHIQQKITLLLTNVHEAARAGDWTAVRSKSEEVLRLNPFNHDARAYWALARDGGVHPEEPLEVRVSNHLEAARIALEAHDWTALGEECRTVLDLEPGNQQAEEYLRGAEETIQRLEKRRGHKRTEATTLQTRITALSHEAAVTPRNGILTTFLAGLVAFVSVCYLASGAFYLWGAAIVDKVAQGSAPASDAQSFDDTANIVAVLLFLGFAAGTLLFLAWMQREITDVRAGGLRTVLEPPLSLAVSAIFGALGTYAVLRDLAARVRSGDALLGELLLMIWAGTVAGGLILSGMVVKQPSDHAEWASLLQLTAYASFLLALAGFLFAYLVRRVHQDFVERIDEIRPASTAEARQTIAA